MVYPHEKAVMMTSKSSSGEKKMIRHSSSSVLRWIIDEEGLSILNEPLLRNKFNCNKRDSRPLERRAAIYTTVNLPTNECLIKSSYFINFFRLFPTSIIRMSTFYTLKVVFSLMGANRPVTFYLAGRLTLSITVNGVIYFIKPFRIHQP